MIIFTQIITFVLCLLFITNYIGDSVANIVNIYGICLPLNPIITTICTFLMLKHIMNIIIKDVDAAIIEQ